jgi:hypothetical protein
MIKFNHNWPLGFSIISPYTTTWRWQR